MLSEQGDNLEKSKRLLAELLIRNEMLDTDTNEFLKELKVTPEQLSQFINKKENFTDENWADLQVERTKLDSKLQSELENIRNPLKAKKAHTDRNLNNQWLFVK